MNQSLVWPALSLALAVPGATQELPQDAGTVPMSADDALMGYYAQLERQVTLPVAPPPAQLAANTRLSRIAFGSCNHQSRGQHMWAQIAASDPQLFMLIGDNVYGDTLWQGDAGLTSLRQAYAEQAAHQEFVRFRADVPMLTTWDDHDFGYNDGGDDFAFKRWAETIYETFWQVPQSVRARPGIYDSAMFGEDGRKVQIILLDTRYFRSQLDRRPYSDERPAPGTLRTTPCRCRDAGGGTMEMACARTGEACRFAVGRFVDPGVDRCPPVRELGHDAFPAFQAARYAGDACR